MKYEVVGNMHILFNVNDSAQMTYTNTFLPSLAVKKLIIREITVAGNPAEAIAGLYSIRSDLPTVSPTLCLFSGDLGVSNPNIEIKLGDTLKSTINLNVIDFTGSATTVSDRLVGLSIDLLAEKK